MEARPLVSVILPVRNGAATLSGAIRSILDQTMEDFELLVIDDGSGDGSGRLAADVGDRRVRILGDNLPRGLGFRLNQGIDAARGKYVARMDTDDLAFPERLARQTMFLEANTDVDLAGCRAVVFRDDGEVLGLFPFAATHEAICAKPWRGFHLAHPTWMGQAAWFRRHRYRIPEVRRAEDQELLLRSHLDSRFACLPEILLAYRLHPFNLSRNWLARRSLGAAQCAYFAGRGKWLAVGQAVTATGARLALDLATALPGGERIVRRRMAGSVPPAVTGQLEELLSQRPR